MVELVSELQSHENACLNLIGKGENLAYVSKTTLLPLKFELKQTVINKKYMIIGCTCDILNMPVLSFSHEKQHKKLEIIKT